MENEKDQSQDELEVKSEAIMLTGRELIIQSDSERIALETQAEQRLKLARRLIQLALGTTNSGDWLNINGKPYLQASGAKKLLKPFGLSVTDVHFETEGRTAGKGGLEEVRYTCFLSISDPQGNILEQVGSASSSDPIFAIRGDKQLPLSEIDLGDVRKKSYTNALNRAVKSLIGLDGITWDDLSEFGLKADSVSGYSHKAGIGGNVDKENKYRKEITDILLYLCNDDEAEAQKKLIEITKFKGKDDKQVPGVNSTANLRGRRLEVVLGKARDLYIAEKNLRAEEK